MWKMVNGRMVHVKELPIVNCDDCGACCRHMGTPPGYAAFFPLPGNEIMAWAKEGTDWPRFQAMPEAIKGPLREYYAGVHAGLIEDRTRDWAIPEMRREEYDALTPEQKKQALKRAVRAEPIPCLWYDEQTKRCRHYEWRPETCREAMKPGDAACRATRKHFKIPLPIIGS